GSGPRSPWSPAPPDPESAKALAGRAHARRADRLDRARDPRDGVRPGAPEPLEPAVLRRDLPARSRRVPRAARRVLPDRRLAAGLERRAALARRDAEVE